ncbi:hypothetical protein [Peribacillus frigoritolerans]|uniref:hypothetical protein n=1 Tax=Peribacillus frigoritolerans TaxID=450367 RepID=UPI003824C687
MKKFARLLPNNWLAETPQALALLRLGRHSAKRERIAEINWNAFQIKKLQAKALLNLSTAWAALSGQLFSGSKNDRIHFMGRLLRL